MIAFPNIDRFIIKIGPAGVSWYSLSYVTGIIIGWVYMNYLVSKHGKTCNLNVNKNHIEALILYLMIGIIFGGRLGYVLFYDPIKFFNNPIDIFKTYEGGMSFHGGLIGCLIASFFCSLKHKLKFLTLIDLMAAAAPIGIFFGRCANFINAELYGKRTDVPWSFIFPGSDYMPRHPSQLYEAILEGLVLFIILYISLTYKAKLKYRGYISGLFLVFYSISRIFVEFFREPDSHIGYIYHYFSMGQILSIPLMLGGFLLISISMKNEK